MGGGARSSSGGFDASRGSRTEIQPLRMDETDLEGGDWDWDDDNDDDNGKFRDHSTSSSSSFGAKPLGPGARRSSSFGSGDSDDQKKSQARQLQGQGRNINIRHTAASAQQAEPPRKPAPPPRKPALSGFGNAPSAAGLGRKTSADAPPLVAAPVVRPVARRKQSKPDDDIFSSMGMNPLAKRDGGGRPGLGTGAAPPARTAQPSMAFMASQADDGASASWGDDDDLDLDDDLFD
mmetsp:Transcript_5952/g.12669  ORF Transcript_5952/g.12669 Transcript_5952/m.12669 type:complete len:235 (-) Transcript_5952:475-1179(-)